MGQPCDLDNEDFTGTSNSLPPAGWIRGPGTNIGPSSPPDPLQDPAVGLNQVGEFMTCDLYPCIGQICFDWHASFFSSDYDVELFWSTDNAIWHSFYTISLSGINSPTTYQHACEDFPAGVLSSPFTSRLRWQMTRRNGGTFYLENVCIQSGSCLVSPAEFAFSIAESACLEMNQYIDVEVCAVDSMGTVSDSFQQIIYLQKEYGAGSLLGPMQATATDGCAIFDSVQFDLARTYVLSAQSNGLSTLSDSIKVIKRKAYGYRDMEYFKLKILSMHDHEVRYALIR